eukprot:scaffold706_cov192-Ochromonas_danica.AAC.1
MIYNVTERFGTWSWARAVVLNGSESIYMLGVKDISPSTAVIFMKFATNGTLIFAKMAEGYAVYANALAIDKENNIIITGYVKGDFQGQTNAGYSDIFIMKYSPSGDLIYTKLYGTNTTDTAEGIGIDSLNNIYLTGWTSGFLNGEAFSDDCSCSSDDDYECHCSEAFLMKLSSTGSVLYTRYGGYGTPTALVLDRDDNVYITGAGDIYYEEEVHKQTGLSIVLWKYDSEGNNIYTKFSGHEAYDLEGNAIAIDHDNGFLYIVGNNFSSSSNTYSSSIVLQKYLTDGSWICDAQYEKEGHGVGVFVDDDHDIFITGYGKRNEHDIANAFYMKVAGPTTAFRTQLPTGAPTQVPTQALATAVPTQRPTAEVPTQVPT